MTVDYTTADGTANAPGDYTTTQGTLTIPAGQCGPSSTACQISVPTDDDTLYENNETFTVTLSNPTGATIADGTATGTIVDNDAQPVVMIANNALLEGNGGSTVSSDQSWNAGGSLTLGDASGLASAPGNTFYLSSPGSTSTAAAGPYVFSGTSGNTLTGISPAGVAFAGQLAFQPVPLTFTVALCNFADSVTVDQCFQHQITSGRTTTLQFTTNDGVSADPPHVPVTSGQDYVAKCSVTSATLLRPRQPADHDQSRPVHGHDERLGDLQHRPAGRGSLVLPETRQRLQRVHRLGARHRRHHRRRRCESSDRDDRRRVRDRDRPGHRCRHRQSEGRGDEGLRRVRNYHLVRKADGRPEPAGRRCRSPAVVQSSRGFCRARRTTTGSSRRTTPRTRPGTATTRRSPRSSPPPPTPTAKTGLAKPVGDHTATIGGVVNPKGPRRRRTWSTGRRLQYGLRTPSIDVGAGVVDKPMTFELTGLAAKTIYHYRVVAAHAGATAYGDDMTFKTKAVPKPMRVSFGSRKPVTVTAKGLVPADASLHRECPDALLGLGLPPRRQACCRTEVVQADTEPANDRARPTQAQRPQPSPAEEEPGPGRHRHDVGLERTA